MKRVTHQFKYYCGTQSQQKVCTGHRCVIIITELDHKQTQNTCAQMIHYLNSSSTCLLFLKKKWMVISLFSPLFPAGLRLGCTCHDVWPWFGTWLHFMALSFPPPATRADVTYSVWTGSVAWLGPSDCTEYNLSQSFRWWIVAQSQRAGRCSSLFSAHISSRRPHNLNSWNSFLRRRLVEDIWLALDCMSWLVTLVALFPALDNRGCTVTHAKIGTFSHVCNFSSSRSFWCLYCIICVCFCCQ